MDQNSVQDSSQLRVFSNLKLPPFSFRLKALFLAGILLILIILGFGLITNRFGIGDKTPRIVIPKTESQAVVNAIYKDFPLEKAKELSDLVVKGDKETDLRSKYSAYQSAWSRMEAVYYSSGRKPEHKEALLGLKELLKNDRLYKEENYEIKE